MWMAVNIEGVKLVDDKLTETIRSFDYKEWDFNYYQNAILLRSIAGDFIRLTTASVYPVYYVMQTLAALRKEA